MEVSGPYVSQNRQPLEQTCSGVEIAHWKAQRKTTSWALDRRSKKGWKAEHRVLWGTLRKGSIQKWASLWASKVRKKNPGL